MSGGSDDRSEIGAEVVAKEEVADGVVRLVLRAPSGREFPTWQPGAHIDVVLADDLIRQYSLCGDTSDRSHLEIAVLREPSSRGGSAFVHDRLAVADQIRIRGPRNHFELFETAEYVFIAGGIGITPILAMLRQVADSGAAWRLVYGGRSRASMAFRDELEDRYGDRVRVRPQDEVGLLDLAAELGSPRDGVAVYCCGPEPLLLAVEEHCREWPDGTLHVERFAPKAQAPAASSSTFEIELARSDRSLTVPADRSVLDVLRDADVDVKFSCLEGTCGTCETVVLAGEPDHRDSILTDEERAANDCMFVCVSRSRSRVLRLDL